MGEWLGEWMDGWMDGCMRTLGEEKDDRYLGKIEDECYFIIAS